ncbi:MAG: bacterioferritin [Fidelibacterota bacterium]
MKGKQEVIDALNQCLGKELTAINQFMIHAKMCKDWGYGDLAAHGDREAREEMKHAENLMERILFLEGTPDMSTYDKIDIGANVKEQIQNDLKLELSNCEILRSGIDTCQKAEDHVTRELFEHMLVEEEGHVDWLETQLRLISEVGYERYLTEHIKGDE